MVAQRVQRRVLLLAVPGLAGGQCPVEAPAPEAGGFVAQGHQRAVDLFPQARHGGEGVRRHLAQILEHGFRALREIHGAAFVDRHLHRDQSLKNMAQRQEAELVVLFPGFQQGFAGGQLEQHVLVADHGALGRAGGAGGIDQHADLVRPALLDAGAEPFFRVRDAVAQLVEFVQEHHHGVLEITQALAVEHDHFLQGGHLVAHGQVLVELLVVLHEQEGGAAVVDQVGELLGAVGGVDTVTDAAGAGDTQIAIQPLLVVLAEDGNRLAAFQAQRQQCHADGAGVFVIVEPAVALPDAQILFAVGDALAPFQALLAPEFDHGVATVEKGRSGIGCSHHQRQVFFRFQRFSGRSSPADWPR